MLNALLFGLLSVTFAHAAPFTLISGYDDVLRQAENQNLWKAALKLREKDRPFAGMPELYQGLTEHSENSRFALVSGTTSLLSKHVEKLLRENHFPDAEIRLRNWFTQWSVEAFKIRSIRDLLGNDPAKKFIVIFDNSEASLEMALSIPETFPNQALAIYLHEIVHRPNPGPGHLYLTAYDIARSERGAGRLSAEALEKVGYAILGEKDPTLVIPPYAYCPKEIVSECGDDLCHRVEMRVRAICRNRE